MPLDAASFATILKFSAWLAAMVPLPVSDPIAGTTILRLSARMPSGAIRTLELRVSIRVSLDELFNPESADSTFILEFRS